MLLILEQDITQTEGSLNVTGFIDQKRLIRRVVEIG